MLLHLGLANALLATFLAVAAWVVGRSRRWAALAYGLWLLVLLKLVTPPLVWVPVPSPAVLLPEPAVPVAMNADAQLTLSELSDTPIAPVTAQTNRPSSPERLTKPAKASAKAGWSFTWQLALGVVWLAGAMVYWSIAAFKIRCMVQLMRGAEVASSVLQAQVRQLAADLGVHHPPSVWLVPVPIPPMLWAVLGTPRLLLPAALWSGLSDEQRTTMLVHELAHLRGRDHWVRRLELIVQGLYWWHPVTWWARRELREAEEQRCDSWVVTVLPAAAAAYAQTLLDTVAFLSRAR